MVNCYAKAYTEVLEILSWFSKEEFSKIPSEKIKYYQDNMDKNYIYTINPNISLSSQYISDEANAILLSLFRDYFANAKQKQTLNKLLYENQQKKYRIQNSEFGQLGKRQKYDSNINRDVISEQQKECSLVEIKKGNKLSIFFKKILRRINNKFE